MITTSAPRWLAGTLAVDAVLAWALTVLMGPGILVAVLMGGLAGTAVTWWQQWRRPEDREQRRVIGRALRDHRDPGPPWRAEVTSAARQRLARPASERWLPAAACAALAGACVLAAVLRSNGTDALPAVPLLVLGPLTVHLIGRRLGDAARWLADPPDPAVVVPAEG